MLRCRWASPIEILLSLSPSVFKTANISVDATFFGDSSGFWNDDMPDAAFRLDGNANGTSIYRPCGVDAPTSCSTLCVWDDVVWVPTAVAGARGWME